jgi:hypothetical protein
MPKRVEVGCSEIRPGPWMRREMIRGHKYWERGLCVGERWWYYFLAGWYLEE